jgi:8-amino-7-oxononanoate synthase
MTAPPLDAMTATTARIGGRDLVVFGGCNYLGLAQHPGVLEAARDAIGRYGLSASASRETTGNAEVHARLESRMADFVGFPGGLLVPDGYLANLTAAQGLAASGIRHAVIDERAHASLRDAAEMGGLDVRTFRHLDAPDAGRAVREGAGPAVVMTDSVFAADGSVAPLAMLVGALRDEDMLLVDDCHGFCVLGEQGRGAIAAAGISDERVIVTTTLAKGLGCGGGMVLGQVEPIERARRSTAYVCTTPVSPILASAALAAIDVLRNEPALHDRLRQNTLAVAEMLERAGISVESRGIPIYAFTAGSGDDMRALHRRAWDAGVWLPLVAYPGGPGALYFRLSVNASHTRSQIEQLAGVLHARTEPDGATR